jgi:peptidoglycan hydrolase-like protein with peptidoglycan-binding domain
MKKITATAALMLTLAATLPMTVSAKHVCVLGAPLENCAHEKASCTELTTNQKVGYKNTSVTKLQTYLAFYGYLSVSPTGYFGVKTQEAVVSFQSAHGIEGTGFVGPLTRAQIKTNSCTSSLPVTPVVIPTPTSSQPQTNQPISSAWSSWTATKLSPLSEAAMTALKQALGAVGVNTNFATTTLTEQEIIEITKKFERDYILNQ